MRIELRKDRVEAGGHVALGVEMEIQRAVVVEPDVELALFDGDGHLLARLRLRESLDAIWLPRGRYVCSWAVPSALYERMVRVVATVESRRRGRPTVEVQLEFAANAIARWGELPVRPENVSTAVLQSASGSSSISELSWMKRGDNWFHKHFDHATRTIVDYLLGSSPLLQGRILDVGCGDGVTDLGVALHCEPELLIGVDPFAGYEALPRIVEDNGLPADAIPPNLRFMAADGNHLPFPDDSFDVVISWGALEHIAGGYLQCLREIKRVLRNGGLFFVVPGLYYSSAGHHLGEFTAEPFAHLTKSERDLHDLVHTVEPNRMDRSGHVATPEEYWRWYKELNPITVSSFEAQLRALEFEPWRVAIRSQDLVEFSAPLLGYSMLDLASSDLYLSCWNRKRPRPPGFELVAPEMVAGGG
jgi:SAM-dependent methyltransferase